ncbi:MAG TPA: hypothetical protein QF644_00550 [Candidatus Poseidoniaceae archaeon]|nr:hypothetical protein [Candidatus Poseidoniaceae archaeon]
MSSEEEKTTETGKNTKYRLYFMLVLWLSINLIWLTLHQQPSLNQVNNPETKTNYNHTVEVPNILSNGKNIPFTLRCNFELSDNSEISTETNLSVGLKLFQNNTIIYEWNGSVGNDCLSWSTELSPGDYRLQTIIPGDHKLIDATVEYELVVFQNFSLEGFFVANIIGVFLVLSEVPRNKNKNKNKKVKGGKWKPKAWDITDATKEVEVGLITTTEDEETIVSDEIAEQRKQYEEDVQRKSLDIIPEKIPVKQPDALEDGDDSALKGELKADERIQRVSDIYDLMDEK